MTSGSKDGQWDEVWLSKPAGFSAAAGWDPVSGLGSIQYDQLLSLFPTTVRTSQGTGCLGCDYYDAESEVDEANYWEEQHSVPSPPPMGSYGG